MQGKLEREGNYELFETTHGHQILSLNNRAWFAVVEGQKGDILINSDSDHKKKKTLKKGKFYLADFHDDPKFRDMPHLFLQEGNKYREWILPNDEPTKRDHRKKLIKTNNLISKKEVEFHVKGTGNKGSEKKYKGTEKYASQSSTPDKKDKRRENMRGPKKRNESLSGRSKIELYELARNKGVKGRSKMTKEELIDALE